MELTDKQWMRIEPVISQSACKKDSRGRKARDPREVLNGILWALRTGAPWKDLPQAFPALGEGRCFPTCYRGAGRRLAGARRV
ncbi:transposase [Desulfobulbus sp. F4]|nr:transposase [Desulfobulbus sp. F4]